MVAGLVAAVAGLGAVGCERDDPTLRPVAKGKTAPPPVSPVPVIASPEGMARPPFAFSKEDEAFLDEVQHGAFNYLWNAVSKTSGMVLDRPSEPVVSVAGVGFQLAGIPVGIERGWITRAQGEERVKQILEHLQRDPEIRKHGLYQHFIDANTSGIHSLRLEHVVSTVDSALLLAGMIVAGEYFGGEIRATTERLVAEADWTKFVGGDEHDPQDRGFISLGWQPKSLQDANGEGDLLRYFWLDSGCEHRLVTFLAVAAPEESKRIPPETYYRLRRGLGEYGKTGLMVWFPYSGALFVNQFSHVFMNYAARGPDDPAKFGEPRRAKVDWWENSRRHTLLHREKAIENPKKLPGFGPNSWGLTASDAPDGYAVPGVFPRPVVPVDAIAGVDYSTYLPADNFGDGTIAPYAAGLSIMFEPGLVMEAMRHFRSLSAKPGLEKVWSDPAKGGYGFADAFNMAKGWVAPDHLAIDHGPLLLAIENARTGLIWRLFEQNATVRAGYERLGLPAVPTTPAAGQAAGGQAAGGPSGR
jgi:hypothetical protein